MFGKNPIRKPEKGDGSILQIQEIFPTVQGEGPRTGEAAVFVRLGGCNLACTFCDTEFEDFTEMALDDILDVVEDLSEDGRRLIVITGGEPFRQNIAPLCEALLAEGYQPQIETNGTLWRELPEAVEVICSPKVTNGKYHQIREDLLLNINALKFVVNVKDDVYSTIPNVGQAGHNIPVWLQPMDEYDADKNQDNLEYTLALAERHGYKVSLQTHKIFGID
jgi:organic radical activating enzyme